MGAMTMEATVIEVEFRKGNRKSDGQPYTCYDIVDQDGVKWVAWEKDLAERAFNLKGQPALWQVEIVQNGQYTNRTLKGIDAKISSGFEPALKAMEASIGTFDPRTHSPGATVTFDPQTAFSQIPGSPGVPRDTDRYIWRQVATKVAATLGGTASEFWDNVEALVCFYETGQSQAVSLGQLVASGQVQLGAGNISAGNGFPTEPPPNDDIPF